MKRAALLLGALAAVGASVTVVRELLIRRDLAVISKGADWIGPPGRPSPTPVTLVRRFDVRGPVANAELRAGIEPSGLVALNGHVVLRTGWLHAGKRVVVTDVGRWLRRGENELAVTLAPGAERGALVRLAWQEADGTTPAVASDGSWTAPEGPARVLRSKTGRTWRWLHGVAVVEPLPALRLGPPRAARRAGEGVWDLGAEDVGFLIVRGVSSGTAHLGESLEEALHPRGLQREDLAARDAEGVGFVRRAFRYVRLEGEAGAAEVAILPVRSPEEPRGSFRCSDPTLQAAYDVSVRTLALCLQSVLEDGVKRDRIAWSGDLVVAAPAVAYLYGAHPAVARTFRLLGATRTPSGALAPSYPPPVPGPWHMHDYVGAWLWAFQTYVDASGDEPLAREMRADVEAQAAWLARLTRAGPFHVAVDPRAPITDWMSHTRRGGTVVYHQAMAIQGLRAAGALGGGVRSARRADALRALVASRLAQTPAGLVRDRLDGGGRLVTHDASVLAVLAGVDGGHAQRILDAVERELWTSVGPRAYLEPSGEAGAPARGEVVAPFMAGLEAQVRLARRDARGYELMRRTWAPMTATGTAYELIDLQGRVPQLAGRAPFAVSLCHSWSAAPAWLLPAYALGVRPEAPGFSRFVVDPVEGDLAWAEGSVPLPGGAIIEISWRRDNGLTLLVAAPAGAVGEIVAGDRDVWRDGLPQPALERHRIPAGETSSWRLARRPGAAPGIE